MKPKGAAWGASFAAMPVAAWPVIAEHLSQPWPEEAARFDLRWFADQNKRQVPGRYDLAERWGWTPDEVRTLLRNAGRWWDPLWGPAPTKREGTLTHGDPARPKLTQADPPPTVEPEESNPPDPARPTVTQADPTSPQRDPSSPSQAPTPPQQDIPAPPVQPTLPGTPPPPPKVDPHRDAWHTAALFWGSQVLPACGRKPSSGPESPTKGIGSKLMTAVRRDPDAVLDALRFMAWSQHDRADFLRSKRYDLDTVLRHVDTYAGLWREFGDRPVSEPQRRTGGPAPPSAGDGALDRLWAKEQARKLAEDGGPDEDDEE